MANCSTGSRTFVIFSYPSDSLRYPTGSTTAVRSHNFLKPRISSYFWASNPSIGQESICIWAAASITNPRAIYACFWNHVTSTSPPCVIIGVLIIIFLYPSRDSTGIFLVCAIKVRNASASLSVNFVGTAKTKRSEASVTCDCHQDASRSSARIAGSVTWTRRTLGMPYDVGASRALSMSIQRSSGEIFFEGSKDFVA